MQTFQENTIWVGLNEKERVVYKKLFERSQVLFKNSPTPTTNNYIQIF
jgi:hypothetical protein